MPGEPVLVPDELVPRAPRRRARGWYTAKLRIVGWVLFAMLLALSTVVVTLSVVLLSRADTRIIGLAEQEVKEFTQFAEIGVDPQTGEVFTDPRALLRVHLARQYTYPGEMLFGWSDGLIRQANTLPVDPIAQPATVDAIIGDRATFGTVQTPAGELFWARTEITGEPLVGSGMFVVGVLTDSEREGAHRTIQLVSVVSVVALLFSCVVAWVVAGRILEPIRLVRQTAAEITEKRLSRRIPVRGTDDIAELARTFNAMLDRLDDAFVTQRQFLDDAGHELRTPITVVQGHLELMGDDPGEQAETLAIVTDELDRMNRIVNDLLILARAEQPDFLHPRPVDLGELTRSVFTKVQRLGERNWVLDMVADDEIVVDPQRLTQAMLQLAQNAVQHTTAGDTIRVGSARTLRTMTLWVADDGPGVPAEDLEIIFTRFSRGSAGGAQSHTGGAGLGLSIVTAIAQAHHGRVWVRNDAGGGARFGIDLPAGPGDTVGGAAW